MTHRDGVKVGWPARAAVAALCAGAAALSACDYDPGYGGRSREVWIAQLQDTSAARRADAADSLGQSLALAPRQPTVVRALIGALNDTSDAVRLSAGNALAREGVRAEGALPGLIAAAADSAHPRVRARAVAILGRVATTLPRREARDAAPTVARALAAALRDSVSEVRGAAALAVADASSALRGATAVLVPALASLSRDADPQRRLAAIQAIAALRPPAALALPLLVESVRDPAAPVRWAGVLAIASCGPQAANAAPTLVHALRDSDPLVRAAAATALGVAGVVGRSDVSAALDRARSDPDSIVRREAAHALAQFHTRGGEDPRPREPTRAELCAAGPIRRPGC